MLYISLTVSGVMLAVVFCGLRSKHAVGCTLGCAGFTFLLLFAGCFLPAVTLQGVFLTIAVVVWTTAGWAPRRFIYLAGAATVAAYGVVGWYVLRDEHDYDALREKYAFESMAERVPPPAASLRLKVLPGPAAQQLNDIEKNIGDREGAYRNFDLRLLHEKTVNRFVNSPGFGVRRMFRPTEFSLGYGLRQQPAIRNRAPRFRTDGSPGQPPEFKPYDGEREPLERMHLESVVDFVNPENFGIFNDRQHVAGFQPHQFSEVPEAKSWRVQAIDLVSLLLHDPPVAYVTANLPRMDELREAPTRPLDRFEREGLKRVSAGDDLFLHTMPQGLRMFGPLRASNQCLKCHDCERGDLLGAFSYSLRSE
jgi:hypothetical protein